MQDAGLTKADFKKFDGKVGLREIIRIYAIIDGEDKAAACKTARHQALKWMQKRAGNPLPQDAWNHQAFEHIMPGRNSIGVRLEEDKRDIWSTRSDDPDKSVPGRVWSTEITVGCSAEGPAVFGLRLLASMPQGAPEISPAVPGLVRQLCRSPGLMHAGMRLTEEPIVVGDEQDVQIFCDMLLSPDRIRPVFAITLADNAKNFSDSILNYRALAQRCAGIAHVAVISPVMTWLISERIGKILSAYNGAVRCYMPGFTLDSDPYKHRLFLYEEINRLGSKGSAIFASQLQKLAADESIKRNRIGEEVVTFSQVQDHILSLHQKKLADGGAKYKERLDLADLQIKRLNKEIEDIFSEAVSLEQERDALRLELVSLGASLSRAKLRIGTLEELVSKSGKQADNLMPMPDSWREFEDWAEKWLVGRLTLSARARLELKKAEYRDVALAARCLQWLASTYRSRKIEGSNENLDFSKNEAIESGVFKARCGGDEFQFEWRGRDYTVDYHIKSGGNTRDPQRMLRIYYFWDPETEQIVVASMPGHLRTGAS